jgi:hypothetical protein
VKSGFSSLPESIRFRLEDYLVKHIKSSLMKEYTRPNRKHFPIPIGMFGIEVTEKRRRTTDSYYPFFLE